MVPPPPPPSLVGAVPPPRVGNGVPKATVVPRVWPVPSLGAQTGPRRDPAAWSCLGRWPGQLSADWSAPSGRGDRGPGRAPGGHSAGSRDAARVCCCW